MIDQRMALGACAPSQKKSPSKCTRNKGGPSSTQMDRRNYTSKQAGWGGYGVYSGDERDTAAYVPVGQAQTNIQAELRAALHALQGHRPGERLLICPDCLLIVNGVLGWAQKWRRHAWTNKSGPVLHRDLWEEILQLTERLGDEVKWLHTLSHIDTPGNSRADHLADVGRRKSPLLFGLISIHPRRQQEMEEEIPEEELVAEWEG